MYVQTLQGLLSLGNSSYAKENANFMMVMVSVNGGDPEIIINPKTNFKAKLEYYAKAYNDDLTLKANPNIKIVYYDCFATANQLVNTIKAL